MVSERLLSGQQSVIQSAATSLDNERSTSQDGYSNPDTYRKAKQQYIAAGGTAANFFQSFPVETYIAPENRKGDLSGATSQAEPGKAQLTGEQTGFINDAKLRIDMKKQQYGDAAGERLNIIEYYKLQGFDISPYI